ncbi:hypothetical protein [Streptomyces sp. NPDC057939]|uniref:hypothetical protein n=1 Tax=Streptomyces sp. NPDC057939 TaxID=3346284 RepID=UPI0036E74D38
MEEKIHRVVGTTLTGAFTGWVATVLWQWATYADEQACAGSVSLCIPGYGFAGLGLWLVLCPLVFFLALRPLGVVPRVSTVPACFFVQGCTLAVLAPLSVREYPEASVVNLTLLAWAPPSWPSARSPRGAGWGGRVWA